MATSDQKPQVYNITNKTQGDTWELAAQITAVDLSGDTVELQIRKKPGTALIKSLTIGNGLTITGSAHDGLYVNTLIDFPAGRYQYACRVTYVSGKVKTFFMGKIVVKPSIIA